MRSLAIEALDELVDLATLEGYSRGRHAAEADIRRTAEVLRKRIESPPGSNPEYAPFGQMAECMLVISLLDPKRYAAMVSSLGPADARTYGGFLQLASILQALGDDHDYTLDVSDPAQPVLTLDAPHGEHVSGASPASVMRAIEPLVEGLFDGPTVAP